MKNNKYYFANIFNDDSYEYSHKLKDILQRMKELDLKETTIFEAVIEIGSEMFYCKEFMEFGDSTEKNCNSKYCDSYQPRNKKSGCCVHRRHCYTSGDGFLLKINGDLIKKGA